MVDWNQSSVYPRYLSDRCLLQQTFCQPITFAKLRFARHCIQDTTMVVDVARPLPGVKRAVLLQILQPPSHTIATVGICPVSVSEVSAGLDVYRIFVHSRLQMYNIIKSSLQRWNNLHRPNRNICILKRDFLRVVLAPSDQRERFHLALLARSFISRNRNEMHDGNTRFDLNDNI